MAHSEPIATPSAPGLTHVRTAEARWIDFPDIPGFRQKPLHYESVAGSRRTLWHVPPQWGEDLIPDEAMLHYHRTVHERAFILAGDFPHWEFRHFDDSEGYVEVLRANLFMDRPPMNLHGLRPGRLSQTGATILYWNTGRGTSIAEPGYGAESVDVLARRRDPALRAEMTEVRMVETERLEWRAHPMMAGWRIRHLAGEAVGGDAVSMIFVPEGTHCLPRSGRSPADGQDPWLYVLRGEMQVGSGDAALRLAAGDYLGRQRSQPLEHTEITAAETGCLAICVGDPLANHTAAPGQSQP